MLHYQPVVSLAEQERVAAVEALVRWHHPERGLVGPGEFIGTAEDTGLIRRLGGWVLHEACRQLAAWDAAGLAGDLTVAVNLSPRQLEDDQLVPLVAAALAEHGLAPERLCVEIGESALADAAAGVTARLRALGDLGVRIAVDARLALAWATGSATLQSDGASPLARIGDFPVHLLKLDRRFVGRMDDRAAGAPHRQRRARPRALDRRRRPSPRGSRSRPWRARSPSSAARSARATRSRPPRRARAIEPLLARANAAPGGARSGSSCATTRPRCATCSARSWSGAATSRSRARRATARA